MSFLPIYSCCLANLLFSLQYKQCCIHRILTSHSSISLFTHNKSPLTRMKLSVFLPRPFPTASTCPHADLQMCPPLPSDSTFMLSPIIFSSFHLAHGSPTAYYLPCHPDSCTVFLPLCNIYYKELPVLLTSLPPSPCDKKQYFSHLCILSF